MVLHIVQLFYSATNENDLFSNPLNVCSMKRSCKVIKMEYWPCALHVCRHNLRTSLNEVMKSFYRSRPSLVSGRSAEKWKTWFFPCSLKTKLNHRCHPYTPSIHNQSDQEWQSAKHRVLYVTIYLRSPQHVHNWAPCWSHVSACHHRPAYFL